MDEQKKLIEIFTFSSGKPIKKNSSGNYPIYGSNGIIGYCDRFNEENVLLIGRAGAAGSIHELSIKAWVTDNVLIAKPRIPIEKKFLYYSLITMNLLQYATKSAQPLLTQQILNPLKVWFPSLQEQRKIASILSNVDSLIQKTDQVIEQTQRLKRGLMQRLLTKGIGHTKFKKTELGEMPEDWTLKTLAEVSEFVTDGSHFSPKHEKIGLPLATVTNMKNNQIDVDSCYKISKDDFISLVRNGCKVEQNDVLFSKDGTVGLCLVYQQPDEIVVLSSIAIIRPKFQILDPFFVRYVLQSDYVLNRILGNRTGTALKRIILKDLRLIKLFIPPLKEQQKIASVLIEVDNLIQKLKDKKKSEEILKKGLMQQLLTGKIRVKV